MRSAFSPYVRHRGFNLVEAAIVLGIIGLVIGGVWVAASSVQRNNRQQELYSALLLAKEAVLDAGRMMPISGAYGRDLARIVFPLDTLIPGSAVPSAVLTAMYYPNANTLFKQLSSGIYLGVMFESVGTFMRLHHMFGPIDRGDCIWIASRLYNISPYPGITALRYNTGNTDGASGGPATLYPTYGPSLATVQSYCAATGNVIQLMTEY